MTCKKTKPRNEKDVWIFSRFTLISVTSTRMSVKCSRVFRSQARYHPMCRRYMSISPQHGKKKTHFIFSSTIPKYIFKVIMNRFILFILATIGSAHAFSTAFLGSSQVAHRPSRSHTHLTMRVVDITSEASFDSTISSAGDSLVIVDYSTTWCGPCKGAFEYRLLQVLRLC